MWRKESIMKKIISLCLALCMFFALAIPAGAANVEESTDRLTTVGELDSAYVDNDTDLMNYDGENITENLPKSTTGMIDESSISLAAVDDVTVLKGSALFAEKGVGAHYYAFSGYSNAYSEAFANIKLPTGFKNNNGARNGYISLGIHGSVHGIDMGLGNEGNGWYPCLYDVNHNMLTFKDYIAPSNATNAKIVVKPVNTTTVHMYIQFLNSAGTNVGKTFDRDITVSSGNLVYSGGKIMCRYYRFASLVPLATDNQSDGTYMTGGQITNCQLYNGSNYVSWGIGTARVTNAWKVSSSKITLSYTTYNDTFNIRHS